MVYRTICRGLRRYLVARPHFAPLPGLMTVAIFALASGCGSASAPPTPISELRIGVLPDESPDLLARNYKPLLEHLSTVTGLECRLVIPESYETLVDQFHAREIDLALFGGATFVEAERRSGAVPLVLREKDLNFTSFFIVRPENPAKSLADLQGSVFCFGSRMSTSGHFMPRQFLQEQGIDPDSFFGEVHYSAAHDETIYRVRDGLADAGAVNAAIFENMTFDGRISYDDIRVLEQTSPYADNVWAAQPSLSPTLRMRLRQGFLMLSGLDRQHRQVLRGLDAMGYLPASTLDFEKLSQIVSVTDVLEERP